MGDLNAETAEALTRHGKRKETWQDARMQEVAGGAALEAVAVGRATYRETSEIDHVMARPEVKGYMWGQRRDGQGSVQLL